MNTKWDVTEYNNLETKPQLQEHHWHIWINPRQPYCDRGHWDWGHTGLSNSQTPTPSYYFMALDTALLEIEEFAFRSIKGMPSPSVVRQLPTYDQGLWMKRKSDGSYHHMRPGRGENAVMVTVSPVHTATGPAWLAECEGIEHLDHSDAFPRLYLHKESAFSEIQHFLSWRLDKTPFESTIDQIHRSKSVAEELGHDPRLNLSEHVADLCQSGFAVAPKAKTRVEI